MIPLLFPKVQEGYTNFLFNFYLKESPTTVFDVSEATSLVVIFRRPDGTTFDTEAEFGPTDDSTQLPGQNGLVQYRTIIGDLVPSGEWNAQLFVYFGVDLVPSSVLYFQVFPNLA